MVCRVLQARTSQRAAGVPSRAVGVPSRAVGVPSATRTQRGKGKLYGDSYLGSVLSKVRSVKLKVRS